MNSNEDLVNAKQFVNLNETLEQKEDIVKVSRFFSFTLCIEVFNKLLQIAFQNKNLFDSCHFDYITLWLVVKVSIKFQRFFIMCENMTLQL